MLRDTRPDIDVSVVTVSTSGDRHKDVPLATLERGTFVKDIEASLLACDIDLAVHSAKDLGPDIPFELGIAAVGERGDPRDVVVSKDGVSLADLHAGARIGTSSPRRTAQIKGMRPDLETAPIRGNVGTRLNKVISGEYDAIVLAAAGLARLDRLDAVTEFLDSAFFIPDVGQGTLVAQFRRDDAWMEELLQGIGHAATVVGFQAERAFLEAIGGGCSVPVAAYATVNASKLQVSTLAALPDGSTVFRNRTVGKVTDPGKAGREAAQALLAMGAREIVA